MRPVGLTCSVTAQDFCVRRAYWPALGRAGLAGVILPPQGLACGAPDSLLAGLSGLVLAGGGDLHPAIWGEEPRPGLGNVDAARDEWELNLLAAALRRGLPVLGICRGMQLLNVLLGGTCWQDLQECAAEVQVCHAQTATPDTAWHTVRLTGRLNELLEARIWVNSLHHQGVRRLGDNLLAEAVAADGLVEAIAVDGYLWARGVQWHPEYLRGQDVLWQDFAVACNLYAGKADQNPTL